MKTTRAALALLGLAPLALATSAAGAEPPDRPNVIIINVDDMGYGDISAHGNPAVTTPNFDRLHGESIRFEDFHAAPMCSPTRSQLLTGIDAVRNGARWVGTENHILRPDLPTMAEMFRDAGYRTGLFGKWHLGDHYPYRPQDRGFQEVLWHPLQEIGSPGDYWGNDYFDDVFEHNGARKRYEGYCTDVFFGEAMSWMAASAEAGEPFLCFLPPNVVHGPYWVAQEYRDRANAMGGELIIPQGRECETFFGMLLNLDDNMGRLMDFLDDEGLAGNTILVFITDNGATGGYNTYNAGMRGHKAHLWEGGHRVPLFVRWPDGGLRDPGEVHGTTIVQDLLPTLLELCSVPAPEGALEDMDGTSLAGVLRGEEEVPERTIVIQFQRSLVLDKYDMCVMRGPWRLVNAWGAVPEDPPERAAEIRGWLISRQPKLELYNLEEDFGQDNDLYAFRPDIVHELLSHYEEWWQRTKPWHELVRPAHLGHPDANPTTLDPASWANDYLTQRSCILDGRPAQGFWNVHVVEAGEYEIALRRWPAEARTPLSAASRFPLTDPYSYGPWFEGTAIPIANALLSFDGGTHSLDVGPEDTAAVFRLRLEEGPARLQGWFRDGDGNILLGAYFATITRTASGE